MAAIAGYRKLRRARNYAYGSVIIRHAGDSSSNGTLGNSEGVPMQQRRCLQRPGKGRSYCSLQQRIACTIMRWSCGVIWNGVLRSPDRDRAPTDLSNKTCNCMGTRIGVARGYLEARIRRPSLSPDFPSEIDPYKFQIVIITIEPMIMCSSSDLKQKIRAEEIGQFSTNDLEGPPDTSQHRAWARIRANMRMDTSLVEISDLLNGG